MKNIVVLTDYQENRARVETFEEAYEIMKKRYTAERESFSEEEWEEEYPKEKIMAEFEAEGYIEFCDGDCIETLEQFIEDLFQKEPKGSFLT